MNTGSTRIDVQLCPDGGWDVTEPGSDRAFRHAETQTGAVAKARAMLRDRAGEIRVHRPDGTVELEVVPPPGPRPWWYQPRGHVGLLIMGALLVVQGLVRVLTDTGLFAGLGWLLLLTGALEVAVVLASQRRSRRLSG